jgi:hypothetical protein
MSLVLSILGGLVGIIIIGGIIALGYGAISGNQGTSSMENKTKALDVFVYLGIFITLIVSVTNVLQIVFAAIDRKFVDLLDYQGVVDAYSSDVRFAIASLIVVYPIYVGLSWFIAKDIAKAPAKQDLKIRKVMIYVALFVTLCTLVGTLVSIIYTYLGGELTIRFGLKALAVFAVALTVFGYYLFSLRRNYTQKTYVPQAFTVGVTLAVVVSLVWSISIVGTPGQMRAKRIDSARLSDISRLQQEVFNHFQGADKLPANLAELNDAFQGYSVPVDPVTKEAYVYKVVQQPTMKMNYTTNKKEMATNAVFELCATFDTERAIDSRGMQIVGKGGATDAMYSVTNYYYEYDQSPFWNHGVGEACFKRIITPDMYYGR